MRPKAGRHRRASFEGEIGQEGRIRDRGDNGDRISPAAVEGAILATSSPDRYQTANEKKTLDAFFVVPAPRGHRRRRSNGAASSPKRRTSRATWSTSPPTG